MYTYSCITAIQQVSSRLQNSHRYLGRPQRYCIWIISTCPSISHTYYYLLVVWESFTPAFSHGFSTGVLSDNKSTQVSRILLSILVDLNNSLALISKSSCPYTNLLVTVPRAPITIGITVTFIFYGFFVLMQGLGTYLYFCFPSFLPSDQPEQRSLLQQVFIFLWFSLGLVVQPRLFVPFLSQNPKEFCASDFLQGVLGLCTYHSRI